MAVHVQRAVTELVPESQSPLEPEEFDRRWEKADYVAAELRRQQRISLRTRACGFDD